MNSIYELSYILMLLQVVTNKCIYLLQSSTNIVVLEYQYHVVPCIIKVNYNFFNPKGKFVFDIFDRINYKYMIL
jgi:hypothetical protein